MNNELTVGQFVAFNMFAQRVAQPIMRMAQLWTDFQQVGISMQRLGDILNTRTEVAANQSASCPALKGRIDARQREFSLPARSAARAPRHQPGVRPGEIIGIVGRSGSGKSTLTKLVQRLYIPRRGRLLVDGIDISLIDAASCAGSRRGAAGEHLLFNRSVRENIAINDPAARSKPSSKPPNWPARMNSSASCPRATTPWWASRAPPCRAASASASPSRVR
jgi:subfamily B ATP-binding cassette protein HlyB/CyaB